VFVVIVEIEGPDGIVPVVPFARGGFALFWS
jgi:hypothetical protein